MSMVMNFAPGVEITLLSKSLMVRSSAVGVPQSKGQFVLSPPCISACVLFPYSGHDNYKLFVHTSHLSAYLGISHSA